MWVINRLKCSKKQQEAAPRRRSIWNFWSRKQGSMSVEFGILAPIFVLMIFSIVDFGHAWYMKMEITSASREGARYGTRYQGPGKLPSALDPSISNWVKASYGPLLPADANLTVTPGGTGYTSGLAGDDLTVTITAAKTWFVINNFIPGLGDSTTLSSTTNMKVE